MKIGGEGSGGGRGRPPDAASIQGMWAAQGRWLFRWRSYIPLPLLLALAAWLHLHPPGDELSARRHVWESGCLLLGLAGIAVRAWIAGTAPPGTSGRNTRGQIARRLNTTGPYSIVRHPLYVANFAIWSAVALFTRSLMWWGIATAYFWACYERIIMAEERFLGTRFGDEYVRWAARTPALVPDLSLWTPPALRFSWRRAARDAPAVPAFVGAIFLLESAERPGGGWPLDGAWVVRLAVAVALYGAVRVVRRAGGLQPPDG